MTITTGAMATGQERRTTAWDAAVKELRAGLPAWQAAPLEERIALLREMRRRVGQEAAGFVAASSAAQSLGSHGTWVTEHWSTLFVMAQAARSLERVLGRIAEGRDPLPPRAVRRRPDGQVVVDVFPVGWDERLLFAGYRAEVWMPPGRSVEQVRAGAAAAYRGAGFDRPGVALLLAAGNVASLVVTDVLHLLYGEGCVVAVKMNPVLGYARPAMERILAPFVTRGWVRFVHETVQAGEYLAAHPGIDRIHMTGSAATYNALVWGVGDDAARNRAAATPLLDKPFTAELGGVAPLIVVPGPWSQGDLRRQADRIVYAKLFNCGHVCASPQVLVLPDGWPLAEPLLDEIRVLMREAEPREPYYPGSQARVGRALADQPHAEPLLGPNHRVLVTGLDPADDSSLFRDEVFADLLGVVRLPGRTVEAYLTEATRFANERLAGTLATTMLVDPVTAKDHAWALDRAVADLRYGAIGINEWAIMSINFGYGTWGGFPGHTPQAIGSGIGTVANAFQLREPQKTVLTYAFRPRLKPLTSVTNRTAGTTIRRVLAYWTSDDLRHLPAAAASAIRG